MAAQKWQLIFLATCLVFLLLDDRIILEVFKSKEKSRRFDPVLQATLENIKILCFSTFGSNNTKQAIRNTWGKRCDSLELFPDETGFFDVKLRSRENLDMELFRKIYQNNFSKADWFFYIPQDVFVILENARLALAKKDPETPYLIGSINHGEKLAFLAISGGFIMSRTALKYIVNGLNQGKWETKIKGSKDIEFTRFLNGLGIRTEDSVDQFGKKRFLPYGLDHLQLGNSSSMFRKYFAENKNVSDVTFSSTTVAISGVDHDLLYVLDYFFYKIRPHGIQLLEKSL
ncbi:glycoprotein-N-acetylgalactosamine 3-beta-galactosyltransferase 1-like isoform X2 [Artemia franciscana]|nr:hypothetical protein QYM36_003149 [Artemia franciscana]